MADLRETITDTLAPTTIPQPSAGPPAAQHHPDADATGAARSLSSTAPPSAPPSVPVTTAGAATFPTRNDYRKRTASAAETRLSHPAKAPPPMLAIDVGITTEAGSMHAKKARSGKIGVSGGVDGARWPWPHECAWEGCTEMFGSKAELDAYKDFDMIPRRFPPLAASTVAVGLRSTLRCFVRAVCCVLDVPRCSAVCCGRAVSVLCDVCCMLYAVCCMLYVCSMCRGWRALGRRCDQIVTLCLCWGQLKRFYKT